MAKKRKTGKTVRRKSAPVARPTIEMLVPCDSVARDPNSQKPTLYGVFNQLLPDKFPGLVRFHLFCKAHGSGTHNLSFHFLGPDGEDLLADSAPTLDVTFPESKGANIQVVIQAKVRKLGEHCVVVKNGRKRLAQVTLVVEKRKLK